jgi:GNAT superfamily N-acetyltransferase
VRIERLDTARASDDELRLVYEVVAANERELAPYWPVRPWEQFSGRIRHPSSWRRSLHWVAYDGDEPVGTASLVVEDRSTNRQHAELEVDVATSARLRGVGAALLRAAARGAEAAGRTVLTAGAKRDSAGEAFAAALGLEPKALERRSGLLLEKVDRSLLESWARGVPGYELVAWDGPCPPELRERMAGAAAVMNTQPWEGLEYEPFELTAAQLADQEEARRSRGAEWMTVAAIHGATGEVAGYTDLILPEGPGAAAEQEDTGVWPEHRNQGLGRWLKAAMLLRILERRPDVVAIETWNAGSNDAMLRINEALGFEVLDWWYDYQFPTQVVLED